MKNLFNAMFEMQKKARTLQKTKRGFNYRYTPLDEILDFLRPILIENQILMTQPVLDIDGRVAVKTILYHLPSGESWENTAVGPKDAYGTVTQKKTYKDKKGVTIEEVAELPKIPDLDMLVTQKIGNDITYLRRYSLSSIFGLASDEDVDGDYTPQQKQLPPKQATKSAPPKREATPEEMAKFFEYANGKIKNAKGVEVFGQLRQEAEKGFGLPLPNQIHAFLLESYAVMTEGRK